MLLDRSVSLWRGAISCAVLLLVLTVGSVVVTSAVRAPASARGRPGGPKPSGPSGAVNPPGSQTSPSAAVPVTPPATPPAPPPPPASRISAAGTVWLCRPGLVDNPCTQSLDATSVAANGTSTPISAGPDYTSRFDCFYAYPTVSTQSGNNANLNIEPAEIAIAISQASLFSQICQVWAPIWRQRPQFGVSTDPNGAAEIAYQSLLAAWRDYMANFNDGRPVVIIGDSQGAIMLARLIASQVDPNPAERRLLVSALLIGANAGGFPHVPPCRSPTQVGCLIGYSSYYQEPPADALFGRLGGVCTNPAALGGGTGSLDPYLRANGAWVTYPGLYTARCVSAGGATWLQVDVAPGDPRPRLPTTLGPAWGLHVNELNLTAGNLVADIATEESAFPGP